MTELIVREKLDKSKIKAIEDFFSSLKVSFEIKNLDAETEKKMSFFDAAGIWKDYDIDGKTLREKAWKRGS